MIVVVLSGSLFLLTNLLFAGVGPPKTGELLPEITLSVPQETEHQKYLGLPDNGQFTIPQIKAEVVLIEFFSMYCPYCQDEAPRVNQFYSKIENNSDLKKKIRLIGIGVGNSSYEVNVFKKKYNIVFPLFSDADFSIHKLVGEVRTPYFIGVKIKQDGTHNIFYSKLGGMDDVDKFLSLIVQLSGL
ncbi:MAG: TlpA family protein disulfide reductase [Desulfobacterales bacterium]|nr:MAG: TlpA family protein disulfide reductase [Desulfobacterales bacterium]UCD91371.1 MAG: TlpA family protein disulfide reductase [Desulfobacterales bacterium]